MVIIYSKKATRAIEQSRLIYTDEHGFAEIIELNEAAHNFAVFKAYEMPYNF